MEKIMLGMLLVITLLLSSCGGGSSGGADTLSTPSNSGNWDQIVWGQDDWN